MTEQNDDSTTSTGTPRQPTASEVLDQQTSLVLEMAATLLQEQMPNIKDLLAGSVPDSLKGLDPEQLAETLKTLAKLFREPNEVVIMAAGAHLALQIGVVMRTHVVASLEGTDPHTPSPEES